MRADYSEQCACGRCCGLWHGQASDGLTYMYCRRKATVRVRGEMLCEDCAKLRKGGVKRGKKIS